MLGSPLILVGANKGGVGKTTVSRLLIDYLQMANRKVRAYDTQSPVGALKRFYPDLAEIVDITKIKDQCRLIESLDGHDAVTVVDMKAGQLISTLRFMRDIGFLDAAARGEARLLVLHLIGASVASLSEIEDIAPFKAKCDYRIVKNHINDSNFFKQNRRFSQRYLDGADEELVVPCLDPLAYEAVELTGLPFSSFVFDEPARAPEKRPRSFVLRGYVRTWLERSWNNFEAAGLGEFASLDRRDARMEEAG
jgi:hypothetical protein